MELDIEVLGLWGDRNIPRFCFTFSWLLFREICIPIIKIIISEDLDVSIRFACLDLDCDWSRRWLPMVTIHEGAGVAPVRFGRGRRLQTVKSLASVSGSTLQVH